MSQYRIKTVSRITNIPIDTIRNWEKRYDFLKPHIGQSGEKFYSDSDVDLLRKMTTLLKSGGRISEIASRILDGTAPEETQVDTGRTSTEVKLMIEDYYQFLVAADLKKIDQGESLIEITVNFRNRIDFIYYPLIERLRHDGAKFHINQAQEHFATGHILNKLKGYLGTSIYNHESRNCAIICSSPSNSIFEGGLLVFAANMKLKGHNIFYLGPNLPVSELKAFASRLQPAVLTISVYDPLDVNEIIRQFENSPYPICVGGLGVRLSEFPLATVGSVHMISYTGVAAVDKVELVCAEYMESIHKR